ncbi:DedA family protein [Actinomadura hibisca]|uniref:DedA family protein n=1 Tax=Actinomadura hibisca TaxID=68565 RepID=UPI000829BF2D|nr:DedA family protein [Actinomadura hibisca]
MRDTFWGMPLWLGVVVAVAIIFVRGLVYYGIGRGVGPRIYTSRLGRKIGEHRLRRVEALVARRGMLAIVGAHWVAGIRHAIPVCAGVMRMPLPRFMLASLVGALLWTPPWVVGGYAVVWGWLEVFGRSPLALAGLVAAVVLLVGGLVALRRRRAATPEGPDQENEDQSDGSPGGSSDNSPGSSPGSSSMPVG